MSLIDDVHRSIQQSPAGLTLAVLLERHPQLARRTAQRLIRQLIVEGRINAQGKGRARRYFSIAHVEPSAKGMIMMWCCTLNTIRCLTFSKRWLSTFPMMNRLMFKR
jgi:hypothetical protein